MSGLSFGVVLERVPAGEKRRINERHELVGCTFTLAYLVLLMLMLFDTFSLSMYIQVQVLRIQYLPVASKYERWFRLVGRSSISQEEEGEGRRGREPGRRRRKRRRIGLLSFLPSFFPSFLLSLFLSYLPLPNNTQKKVISSIILHNTHKTLEKTSIHLFVKSLLGTGFSFPLLENSRRRRGRRGSQISRIVMQNAPC